MEFRTSNINVNNVWRELLIVSDTKEIPQFLNGVITQKQGDYEVIYYTDGIYQSKQEGDIFYNWYLINATIIKETAIETVKRKVEELKTNNADLAEAIVNLHYEREAEKLNL